MKKIITMILMFAMVLSVAGLASADSRPFDISTDSTSVYQVGTIVIPQKTNATWCPYINEGTSNLSETHRAVTRVHKGATAISATWVYSKNTYEWHPYKTNYTGTVTGITYRGRLDTRDSGILEFHGDFHY